MEFLMPIKSLNSKKGFTLVELLVYMALASIVVGLAGQAYLDATRLKVRTEKYLESTAGANEALVYLEEDLRRIGVKGSKAAGASPTVLSDVYINQDPLSTTRDSSSFVFTNRAARDSITYRAAIYDGSGTVTGWESVAWWADASGDLYRQVKRLSNGTVGQAILMARGVDTFNLDFGIYTTDSVIQAKYRLTTTNLAEKTSNAASVIANNVTGEDALWPVITNFDDQMNEFWIADNSGNPRVFSFVAGQTYRIQLGMGSNLAAATNFSNTGDYIALTLRKDANENQEPGGIADFQFYSGRNLDINDRIVDFAHSDPAGTLNCRILLRFQMRPAMSAAEFRFDSLSVVSRTAGAYDFENTFAATLDGNRLKARAKSLRIILAVNKAVGTSTISRGTTTLQRVIPIPNNGV